MQSNSVFEASGFLEVAKFPPPANLSPLILSPGKSPPPHDHGQSQIFTNNHKSARANNHECDGNP